MLLKLMTLFEVFLTYDNSYFLVVRYTDARIIVYRVCQMVCLYIAFVLAST